MDFLHAVAGQKKRQHAIALADNAGDEGPPGTSAADLHAYVPIGSLSYGLIETKSCGFLQAWKRFGNVMHLLLARMGAFGHGALVAPAIQRSAMSGWGYIAGDLAQG